MSIFRRESFGQDILESLVLNGGRFNDYAEREPVSTLFEQWLKSACRCKRAQCAYDEEFDAYSQHMAALADLLKDISSIGRDDASSDYLGAERHATTSGLASKVSDSLKSMTMMTLRT